MAIDPPSSHSPAKPRPVRAGSRLLAGLMLAVCAIAFVALFGWSARIPSLVQFKAEWVPMQINTGVCFFTSAAAVWLLHARAPMLPVILSAISAAIGLLTLAQYVFHVNLGIDEMLGKAWLVNMAVSHPGRMAPLTAIGFAVAGIGVLFSAAPKFRRHPLSSGLAGLIILPIGGVTALCYATGLLTAYGWSHFTRMAANTSLCFVLLGCGFLVIALEVGKERRLPPRLWAPIPGAIILIGILAFISWQMLTDLNAASNDRLRLAQAFDDLQDLKAAVTESQIMVAHLVIDGAKPTPGAVPRNHAAIHRSLRAVRDELGASHRELTKDLAAALAQLQTFNETVARVRRQDGFEAARSRLREGTEPASCLLMLEQLLIEVRAAFADRNNRIRDNTRQASVALTSGYGIAMALLLVSGIWTRREMKMRRWSEERFRDSSEKFELAAHGAVDGIWDWNVLSGELYLSDRWCELVHFSPGELPATIQSWEALLHPDDKARALQEVEAHFRARAHYVVEYRLRSNSGEYRWFRAGGQAKWDENGRAVRMAGSLSDITAEKLAREQLQAREELLKKIIDLNPSLIFVKDREGRFTLCNQAAADFNNCTIEDMVGQCDTQFVPNPNEVAKYREDELEVIRTGADKFVESEICTDSQGRVSWFQTMKRPLFNAEGDVTHVLGISTDLTEKKLAQERLVASEALLLDFIRFAPAAIAMLDTEMRYLRASERWINDYHLDGTNIIGRSHYEVFPDIPQRWKDVHQRVLAGAVERCSEDLFEREDGADEWLQWEARPWRRSDGAIGGVIFFTQVITAQKEAQEQLRLSEERFRNAVEYSSIGIALVAPDGRWLKVNAALCQIVGHSAEDLLHGKFQDITHPDDLENDLAQVRDLLAGHITHYRLEKRYWHRAGHVVWALLGVALVRDGAGEPLYFVSQIIDITERKLAESALRASLAEKETLLREIHHRVKNNMQVISSLIGLQSGFIEEPKSKHFFQECQRRVRTMAMIHEKLYRSANLATLDFGEHLRDITGMFAQAYSDAARRVTMEVRAETVTLDMDTAIPLGLIVNELVSNALKHGFPDQRSGRLLIRLSLESELLCLQVSDDGTGLPAHFSATESGSLGMKLVRSLSRQIRAECRFDSTGPGTTITIKLKRPARK